MTGIPHMVALTSKCQILIYLGRSYFADGDYDKAMSIYTNALDIAGKNKLNTSLDIPMTI